MQIWIQPKFKSCQQQRVKKTNGSSWNKTVALLQENAALRSAWVANVGLKKLECVVVPFLSLAVTENGLWLQTNCDICGFKVQASLNRVHNSDIESLYKYIYQKPNRAVWVEVLLWMNWMWVVPLGSGGCLSTWYWAAWPQSNPTSIKGLTTLKLQTEIFRSGFSSLKILWAFWGLSLVVSEFKF